MVSFKQSDEKVVFHAAGAAWTVWTRHTSRGEAFVGPGYIGRVELPSGRVIVDDFGDAATKWTVNDPRYGGLGCFGVHLARRNEHFPAEPPNFTWDLTGRMAVGSYGVNGVLILDGPKVTNQGVELLIRVSLTDGESFPRPLLVVSYDYLFTGQEVRCHVDVVTAWDGAGSPAFVKEPKVACGAITGYRFVDLLGPKGAIRQAVELDALPDPGKRTLQFPEAARTAIRFSGGHQPALTIRCDRGLERWTRDADQADPLTAGPCDAYCLDTAGKLRRQWEVAHRRGEPYASAMFHAWEGGAGLYHPATGAIECPCASRALPAREHRYTTLLRYSIG